MNLHFSSSYISFSFTNLSSLSRMIFSSYAVKIRVFLDMFLDKLEPNGQMDEDCDSLKISRNLYFSFFKMSNPCSGLDRQQCLVAHGVMAASPPAPEGQTRGDCWLWLRIVRLFNLRAASDNTERQCTFSPVTTFLKIITFSVRQTLYSTFRRPT